MKYYTEQDYTRNIKECLNRIYPMLKAEYAEKIEAIIPEVVNRILKYHGKELDITNIYNPDIAQIREVVDGKLTVITEELRIGKLFEVSYQFDDDCALCVYLDKCDDQDDYLLVIDSVKVVFSCDNLT